MLLCYIIQLGIKKKQNKSTAITQCILLTQKSKHRELQKSRDVPLECNSFGAQLGGLCMYVVQKPYRKIKVVSHYSPQSAHMFSRALSSFFLTSAREEERARWRITGVRRGGAHVATVASTSR